MQSPAPGREEQLVMTQAGNQLAGDQLYGKRLGGLHGEETAQEAGMCPDGKGGCTPRLYSGECSQEMER